ncbi:TPA: hypothetical protein ACU21S_002103 [Mannheimia haemolytica]
MAVSFAKAGVGVAWGGKLGNVVLETVLQAELEKRTFEFAEQERALMQGLL